MQTLTGLAWAQELTPLGDISMEKGEQSKDPTWRQEEEACTGIVGRNFPRR